MISDALSLLGNSIAGVVLPLVLLARTGDALAAGSLAIICAVPQFICGLVGGAALDKLNRRRVCMASDLVSALSVALLHIVEEIWGLSFGWFVVLGLLGAVGDVPGMTARDALLRASTLLSFGIPMVMGSWQGIVLPAHFTAMWAMSPV